MPLSDLQRAEMMGGSGVGMNTGMGMRPSLAAMQSVKKMPRMGGSFEVVPMSGGAPMRFPTMAEAMAYRDSVGGHMKAFIRPAK